MYELWNISFQILLYFGIIVIIAYFIYPRSDNIEKYFQNKVVWITGASSGIGRELAKELARLSPTTYLILSSRREHELESLAKELNLDSDHYLVVPLDLEDNQYGFQSKVNYVLNRFQHIDILFNNAGVSQRGLIKDTIYKVDARIMNINYLGTITLTKAILPHFIERQQGHFVVISSIIGYVGTPMRSAYAASKHALHGFFDSLRLEHTKDCIDVTVVCPGFVRTDISKNALEATGVLHQKMDPRTASGTDPKECAFDILRGVSARKHEVYCARDAYYFIYLRRFFPKLLYKMLLRTQAT